MRGWWASRSTDVKAIVWIAAFISLVLAGYYAATSLVHVAEPVVGLSGGGDPAAGVRAAEDRAEDAENREAGDGDEGRPEAGWP